MLDLKNFVTSYAKYGVGIAVSKGTAFLLLPIYVSSFSIEEYGILDFSIVMASTFGVIMMLGLDSAQSYFFYHANDRKKQNEIFSKILLLRIISGVIFIPLSIFGWNLLNIWIEISGANFDFFLIYIIHIWFFQMFSQYVELYRLNFQALKYSVAHIAYSILTFLAIVFAVTKFDLGIMGIAYSMLLISFAAVLYAFYKSLAKELLVVCKSGYPQILKFSAPFIISGLMLFVMQTIDRWMIANFLNHEDLGIFAFAIKLVAVVGVIVEIFRKTWIPVGLKNMSEGNTTAYSKMIRIYIFVFAIIAITFVVSFKLIFASIIPDEYTPALSLLPWLIFCPILYGLNSLVNYGIWKTEKTFLNLYPLGGAIICNVVLNYLLMEELGLLGVSMATLCSYIFWILSTFIISQRLVAIDYISWRKQKTTNAKSHTNEN